MSYVEDELPCNVCGKMARTKRDRDGNAIQAGCQTECIMNEQAKAERKYKQELMKGEN